MKVLGKCRNVYVSIKENGVKKTANHYLNRKKEREQELQIIRRYHMTSGEEKKRQRSTVWNKAPKISIITPLYNTPEIFLRELLDSVMNQTYVNWELCLADGSDDEHAYVGDICRERAEKDERIIYKKLEKNEGIVGNTNQCIAFSTGEYLSLLDHDDILHESALYEVASAIEQGADFVYTDELKFSDIPENSMDIVCKNGFGKDELRSHNYICHLVAFRKSLLDDAEEVYRKKCEGSQDYDMVLRMTEKAKKIVHIPKILYYWRVHQGSVSMDLSVKQYAVDAAKYAIADQLERSKDKGSVECNFPYETIYRINYDLKATHLVSIYVWLNGRKEAAEGILRQIIANTGYKNVELIVSEETETDSIDGVPVITVQKETDNCFAWYNHAEQGARGEYNLYISSDCLPETPAWIEEMLMYVQRYDVGVAGPHILYRNNHTYFAGAVLDADSKSGIHVIGLDAGPSKQGYEANLKYVRNTTILSSLCMMISRKRFRELDGFRESMGNLADADLCLRCQKAGYQNVWTCFAKMSYTGNKTWEIRWENAAAFRKFWNEDINQGDEYYHPLLKKLQKM